MAQLSSDETLNVWLLGMDAPQQVDLIDAKDLVWNGLCLNDDGTTAYTLNNDNTAVEIWNFSTGALTAQLKLPLGRGYRTAVSRDGRLLFVRLQSSTDIPVLDLQSNRWRCVLQSLAAGFPYGCVVGDGDTIVKTSGFTGNASSRDIYVYTLP
jgi:DNA-binding beta-propeller fold protein YncE